MEISAIEQTNEDLLELALLGDKSAQLTLSYRYENGVGAEVSLVKAYAWAYVFEPNLDNKFLKRITYRISCSVELNLARVFAIKLSAILTNIVGSKPNSKLVQQYQDLLAPFELG